MGHLALCKVIRLQDQEAKFGHLIMDWLWDKRMIELTFRVLGIRFPWGKNQSPISIPKPSTDTQDLASLSNEVRILTEHLQEVLKGAS